MKHGLLGLVALMALAVDSPCTHATDELLVTFDQAKVLRLPRPAADITISNPSIADVSVVAPSLLAITGKSYGTANLIVRDADGLVTADLILRIRPPTHPVVVLNLGSSRRTLGCTPRCEPMLDIRDSADHFEELAKQVQSKMSQSAQGDAPAFEYPCDSPRQLDSAGRLCGKRSAYNRPGGREGTP